MGASPSHALWSLSRRLVGPTGPTSFPQLGEGPPLTSPISALPVLTSPCKHPPHGLLPPGALNEYPNVQSSPGPSVS